MRWGILFAGIGGVEWGLEAAGHQPIWAVEMDPIAAEYHRRNHPNTQMIASDVQQVDVCELPNIDALHASPPCQGHSRARSKGLSVREDVWVGRDILRYARELAPRLITVENVPQYARHAVFREIVAGLDTLGYHVEWRVLNCADYGIAQTRERLIVQARRDGQIAWPVKAKRRVGWYEVIQDILPAPDRPLAPWQASRWNAAYNQMRPVYVDWQFAAARTPGHQKTMMTIRQEHEPSATITAHSNRQEVVYPVLLDGQLVFNDVQRLHVIEQRDPAPTIMASAHSVNYIVYPDAGPMRARLNARCSARLQTIPDAAILPETQSQAIRLIGNAVPPLLMQRIVEASATVWQGSLFHQEAA